MTTTADPTAQEHRQEAGAVAHISHDLTPTVALCGKRIVGIAAPSDAPTCAVCEDMVGRAEREARTRALGWDRHK